MRKDRPQCYFAHPVTDYGGERERVSVELIEGYGYGVLNPNSEENERGYRERGMQHFLDLIGECEVVAFQRFPGGEIGAGVAKEIAHALELGLTVYEVTEDEVLESLDSALTIEPDVLSVEATRRLIQELRIPPNIILGEE